MKLTMIYLAFTLLLAACGQQSSSDNPDGSFNKSGGEGHMSVVLVIPDPTLMGATRRINYNNKSYLIGSSTSVAIVNQINNFSQGSHNVYVKGSFTQESGLFPNPTATFNVINITSFTQSQI